VEVRDAGAVLEGRVQGLDAQGRLVVVDSRGVRQVVTTGDLRLLD
jgi:biotin-(acetyl-CoA carboxylase) ligase